MKLLLAEQGKSHYAVAYVSCGVGVLFRKVPDRCLYPTRSLSLRCSLLIHDAVEHFKCLGDST